MAALSELRSLNSIEKLLETVLSDMKDQLNKLKVEELAIMDAMREARNREEQTAQSSHQNLGESTVQESEKESTSMELDLNVNPNWMANSSANEEYEDEESEEDTCNKDWLFP